MKMECSTQSDTKFDFEGWSIDHSAGRPILMHNNCSVIEAEQAYGLLELIKTAAQPQGEPVATIDRARKIEQLRGAFEQRFKLDIWPVIDWLRNSGIYAEQPAPIAQGEQVEVIARWSDWSMLTLEIDGQHRTYVDTGKSEKPHGEPVEYQSRTRPLWRAEDGERAWFPWEKCSAESFANYQKNPLINDWQYQVRALYAEQPAPVAVALPSRRAVSPSSREQAMCANTWNACLDELERLNPSL